MVLVEEGRGLLCGVWKEAWLTLWFIQGGVGNRVTSRSKYGTKKPKKVATS
jgi:hypothetical protein